MSNADRYFGVFDKDTADNKSGQRAEQPDSSLDELVKKVKSKAKTSSSGNYNRGEGRTNSYKSKDEQSRNYSPGPEKVGSKKSDKKESLDDVVKNAKKASEKTKPANNTASSRSGNQGQSGKKSSRPYDTDSSYHNKPDSKEKADPIKYFIGEVIDGLKETYVPNPQDYTYMFSRRLIKGIVRDPDTFQDRVLNDGLSIGIYKLLDELLKSVKK